MSTVIQEFLSKLSFKVDGDSAKKFRDALGDADKGALALATGITAAAAAVAVGVELISDKLEKIYYASRRTASSSANILALQSAAKQIGLTAEQAQGALDGFASAIRTNPGLRGGLSQMFGIDARGKDNAEVMLALVDKLRRMPFFVAKQYGAMYGIDENTLVMMEEGYDKMVTIMAKRKEAMADAGIDADKATQQSMEFKNSLRDLMNTVDILGIKMTAGLVGPLKEGVEWLIRVESQIEKWLSKVHSVHDALKPFGEFSASLEDIVNLTKELVGNIWSFIKAIFSSESAVSEFGEFFKNIFHGVIAAVKVVLELLTGRWGDAWSDMKDLAKDSVKAIVHGVKAMGDVIGHSAAMLNPKFHEDESGITKKAINAATKASGATMGPGSDSIGMRDMNPGNLRSWGGHERVGGFAKFSSMDEGMSAMAQQLITYGKRNIDTIQKIISTYAPSNENDTASYVAQVSKAMSIGSGTKLDLNSPKVLESLMSAMITREQGYNPFSTEAMDKAVSSRLGGSGQPGGVTINQTTQISASGHGSSDTARLVVDAQDRVNGDLLRNMKGAAR